MKGRNPNLGVSVAVPFRERSEHAHTGGRGAVVLGRSAPCYFDLHPPHPLLQTFSLAVTYHGIGVQVAPQRTKRIVLSAYVPPGGQIIPLG